MKSILCLAAGLVLSAGTVAAQELVPYGEVGPWAVYTDPASGNGCLINAVFEDGSDVRIGFDVAADNGYMVAANAAWGDIVVDTIYPLTFDLDGEMYEGEGTGTYIDDLPGVDIAFDDFGFMIDIAKKQMMTLYSGDKPVMAIDMAGSAEALAMAVECQEAQG